MAVTQDERAPGADIVDIAVVIGIDQIGILTGLEEQRISANAFEGSDWTIYAAGHMFNSQLL